MRVGVQLSLEYFRECDNRLPGEGDGHGLKHALFVENEDVGARWQHKTHRLVEFAIRERG